MTDDIGKILADAFAYGTGFAVGGKHVPFEDVYLDPRDAAQSTCQRSYNEGAADERAKIVAWLRDSHKGRLRSSVLLAQSIEANVHTWNGKGVSFPKREHLK